MSHDSRPPHHQNIELVNHDSRPPPSSEALRFSFRFPVRPAALSQPSVHNTPTRPASAPISAISHNTADQARPHNTPTDQPFTLQHAHLTLHPATCPPTNLTLPKEERDRRGDSLTTLPKEGAVDSA
ncbi:hypothetical protein ACOMHN_030714 [Nucella lapillus]